jgi:hypothetical protein
MIIIHIIIIITIYNHTNKQYTGLDSQLRNSALHSVLYLLSPLSLVIVDNTNCSLL